MYVIITGASNGIGLQLTHVALKGNHNVLAVARHPEQATELLTLKQHFDKLKIAPIDLLENDAEVKIKDNVQSWPQVDVIINNAGVYYDDQSLKNFQDSFLINSIKPLFITRTLLDKLKLSKNPKSIQISSLMGSIGDNNSGHSYSYRASKAALNMIFKSFSIDHPWLLSLLIHPGWVKTKMGGEMAPLSAKESAEKIWDLILSSDMKQTGTFLNYKGEILPW